MADPGKYWQHWRSGHDRRVDSTGLLFLATALLTTVIFLISHGNTFVVCLLLLLPLALIAVFGGWIAGGIAGVVAAVLTMPHAATSALITPQLGLITWSLLALCYVAFGLLLGLRESDRRRQRGALYVDIEDKLEHAKVSAERYEALLEEMSEGQEFLQRMNEELAILNTIATAVNSSLDVAQVQETAMLHIETLMNVDAVQIYWIHSEQNLFILQAEHPAGMHPDAMPTLPLAEGILGQLVQGKRAVRISESMHNLHLRPPTVDDAVKSIIAVPLRSRARLFGALVLGRRSGRTYSEDDEKFLASVGRVLAVAIENAMLFQQTRELSLADELTGLANRRMFNRHLSAEINNARVTNSRLCLVLFDLDYFKQVNDRHGHLVGDEILRKFARAVQDDLRGSDLFCRYGGEEFALIAPDLTLAEASSVAERVCRRIAATPFTLDDGTSIALTVSAGVASLHAGCDTDEALIAAADQALLAAKAGGRNRVVTDAAAPAFSKL